MFEKRDPAWWTPVLLVLILSFVAVGQNLENISAALAVPQWTWLVAGLAALILMAVVRSRRKEV